MALISKRKITAKHTALSAKFCAVFFLGGNQEKVLTAAKIEEMVEEGIMVGCRNPSEKLKKTSSREIVVKEGWTAAAELILLPWEIGAVLSSPRSKTLFCKAL